MWSSYDKLGQIEQFKEVIIINRRRKKILSLQIIERIKDYNDLRVSTLKNENGEEETKADYLIRVLTPFVAWFFRHYYADVDISNYEDMFQHAFKAISEHAEEFNPNLGFAPSTFFAPYIKEELNSYFRNATGISKYKANTMKKVKDAVANSENNLSTEEIANNTGLTEQQVKEAIISIRIKEQKIFPDWLDPNRTENPSAEENSDQVVREALNNLEEQENYIIRHRFGIDCAAPLSAKEIGEQLHIETKTVYRILRKALNKLKKDKSIQLLYESL